MLRTAAYTKWKGFLFSEFLHLVLEIPDDHLPLLQTVLVKVSTSIHTVHQHTNVNVQLIDLLQIVNETATEEDAQSFREHVEDMSASILIVLSTNSEDIKNLSLRVVHLLQQICKHELLSIIEHSISRPVDERSFNSLQRTNKLNKLAVTLGNTLREVRRSHAKVTALVWKQVLPFIKCTH
jgi:hypothetical protein